MKKIILHGCSGRMGKAIQEMVQDSHNFSIVAGVDHKLIKNYSFPIFKNILDVNEIADIIVDFSHYTAVSKLIQYSILKKKPLIVATTGLTMNTKKQLKNASLKIPIFYSENMSLGINILIQIIQSITPILENDFNIEIIEKHHRDKKDSPSGTALLLADKINETCNNSKVYKYGRSGRDEKNLTSKIGIHSVRGGTFPGEHSVLYAGNDEILEIKHTALSRKIFAKGVLAACMFLMDKKEGLYGMSDLLKNSLIKNL